MLTIIGQMLVTKVSVNQLKKCISFISTSLHRTSEEDGLDLALGKDCILLYFDNFKVIVFIYFY